MEGNVQYVMKQVSKFDGKNADYFREWYFKLRVSLSLYSNPIFEVVQRLQRPSDLDNDQATAREGWDDAEDGVGHGQDVWAALREKFNGCSRETLPAAHREMETV